MLTEEEGKIQKEKNHLARLQINYAMKQDFMLLDDFLAVFKDSGVPSLTKRVPAIKIMERVNRALGKKLDDDPYYVKVIHKHNGKKDWLLTNAGMRFFFWELPNRGENFRYKMVTCEKICQETQVLFDSAQRSNPEGMAALRDWAINEGSAEELGEVLIKHGKRS